MELNKGNIKKIIGIISFSIILYFVLQNLQTIKNIFSSIIDILSPFLFGAGLAFVLNIPMEVFERKLFKPKKMKNGKVKNNKLKRPVCIILSIILVIFIISFVVKLVIPQLLNVVFMCIRDIPSFARNLKDWAIDFTEQYPEVSNLIKSIEINWDQITAEILNFIKNFAGGLVTSSLSFVVSLIGGIFNTIIAIVFSIYILISKEKLKEQLKKIVGAYFPTNKAKYVLEIASLSKNTFYNFITGQCTEAVILGGLCFIGMIVWRLPFAATISVLVGVMALIPIVGAFIGLIIGAILILSIDPIKSVIFIIFLLILQQIEGNLIYPKVVGESVGLPGMWVLVAVSLGGSLGGILGLLIGLPTVSVIYTILKNDVNKRLKNKDKTEKEMII